MTKTHAEFFDCPDCNVAVEYEDGYPSPNMGGAVYIFQCPNCQHEFKADEAGVLI